MLTGFIVISCITNKYLLIVTTVLKMIKAASLSGLSPDSNDTADGFWKFTSSSVFAATVVTTIGEGWNTEFESPVYCVASKQMSRDYIEFSSFLQAMGI